MSKFDERYEIRLASYEDIEEIMSFIDRCWRKNHILAKDRILFEYEFLEKDRVNMVLAVDRKMGSLEGIFGFLPCSHIQDKSKWDIWGSLWKVNEEHGNMPLLGIEMAKKIYELTGCRMCLGGGVNPKSALPLRKKVFKDRTGKMKQYYCLNPDIEKYRICKIEEARYLPYKEKQHLQEIVELPSMEELKRVFDVEKENSYPYKDNWYVEKRYYRHPYYKYQVFGLKEEKEVLAVVVCRSVEAEGTRILRIVDYMGKHQSFAETGEFWRKQMTEHQYEYVDFYEFGMDDKILEDAGFVCRKEEDANVIPNYFGPFLQKNVDIWVSYKFENTTFFKADSDQDRPNLYVSRM